MGLPDVFDCLVFLLAKFEDLVRSFTDFIRNPGLRYHFYMIQEQPLSFKRLWAVWMGTLAKILSLVVFPNRDRTIWVLKSSHHLAVMGMIIS